MLTDAVAADKISPGIVTELRPEHKMAHQDRRRRFKRYPARWKVAVVFAKADNKPTVHCDTRDLSIGGASIISDYPDLTGITVTLLLARPVRPGAAPPKMIKLQAQFVSSVHVPTMSGYRHGLKFIPSKDDGMGMLAEIINAAETARRTAPAPDAAATSTNAVPANAETMPAQETEVFQASPGSLLARLREAAQAKLREQEQAAPRADAVEQLSRAVQASYRSLKAALAPLAQAKPDCLREYNIPGLPNFDGLKWKDVAVDFRTRELSPTRKVYDRATVSYQLAADKSLSAVRETPADEKLKRVLEDARVEYSALPERNSRGSTVGTKFVVPCEVKAGVEFTAQFETGKLILKLRNVERFGTAEYVIEPAAVTEEALREFARYIVGEKKQIGALIQKGK